MRTPEVLKISDFTDLFFGRVLATIALQAQAVIVGWHVYELSHDPLMLGLIGLTEAIPAIGFAFLAGHIVDNRKPVSVYRVSLLVLLLNTVMIWLATLPAIPLAAATRLALLYLGVFVSGASRSFTAPSVFTLISHIVPRPLRAQAAAWNSWAFQMAAICGPAMGGLIYGFFGVAVAFALPPLFIAGALLSLQRLSSYSKNLSQTSKSESFVASVRSGILFTFKQRVLLSAMTLDMFSVLFGGAVAVLPIYSDQILHAGSLGLGFLRAAPSVGSGLVALFLAFRSLHTISGRMLLITVAGFGVSIIAFAFSTQFVMAFICLGLSGAFDGVSMVIRGTILQLLTPDEMRGRVSSLSMIFITSSNEIGAFESGVAAKLLGLIPSLVFGGAMTLVVVGATAWAAPELRATRLRPGEEERKA